jgi:hypothetical protein
MVDGTFCNFSPPPADLGNLIEYKNTHIHKD